MTPCRPLHPAALRGWPLPRPDADGDKETRGRAVIVAGSREMPGAAVLAATAALRAGAGKVVVCTAASAAMAVAATVPEARVIGLQETPAGGIDPAGAEQIAVLAQGAGALLVGPGMQDEPACCALAFALCVQAPDTALLLDAAAMGAVLQQRPWPARPPLLTPHAGEMAHLAGIDKQAVLADAHAAAADAARRWHALVVLKGASTVLAHPDGQAWRHDGGSVGLATAGSGDVLAGLVAGLAARGAPLEQAAAWGVVLHALAGERLSARLGRLGYLARELAAEVPALMDALAGP